MRTNIQRSSIRTDQTGSAAAGSRQIRNIANAIDNQQSQICSGEMTW
jgi:hypothetical protein